MATVPINVNNLPVATPSNNASIVGVEDGKFTRFLFPVPQGLNQTQVAALVSQSAETTNASVNQKIAALAPNLVPADGTVGQILVKTAFGRAWVDLTGGSVVVPTTPPAPAPSPSPTDYDYVLSVAAANSSTLNMRTKTAQLA